MYFILALRKKNNETNELYAKSRKTTLNKEVREKLMDAHR